MSYISKEEAVKAVNDIMSDSAITHKFRSLRLRINKIPTADVAEVKHGEWEDRDGKTWCSLCGQSNKQYKPPYCPHCGAIMDGGAE